MRTPCMQNYFVLSTANQPEREIAIFFQSWRRRVRMNGMDDIETITDEPEEPEGEEPWCLTCRGYTDYRRRWATVPRADTDGGTYSDVVETPYCIDCEEPMHKIGTCRNLVWAMNSLACATWTIALLTTLTLFDLSAGSVLGFALSSLLCLGISRVPAKSRKVLRAWKRWKHEEALKELMDQIPKE